MAIHSGIKDDGVVFQIIPTTKKISVPPTHKVIGSVGDHNSEEITFMCPKTIDGHDVSACTDHYVSWMNADGKDGKYDIKDIRTEGDNMYFTWVIESGVTAKAGNIKFAISFEDKDADGALLYAWSTTICTECQILDTLRSTNSGEIIPIPDGYVKPTGSITIDHNGTFDVTDKVSAVVSVVSDGVDINGIIREYEVNAGATVNAGDFVEFINKFGSGEFTSSTVSDMDAAKLDNNRVLVTYVETVNYSKSIKARLITINGTSVSIGTSTTISNIVNRNVSVTGSHLAVLTNNIAILACGWSAGVSGSSPNKGSLYPLKIEKDTITIGTAKDYCTADNPSSIAITRLTDSTAFLSYVEDDVSIPHRYAALISTDGVTASILTQVTVSSSTTNGTNYRLVALTENKVLATYTYTTGTSTHTTNGFCRAFAIDNTDIVVGNSRPTLSINQTGGTVGIPTPTVLSDEKVLITYDRRDSVYGDFGVHGIICTVEGTVCTLGEAVKFTANTNNRDVQVLSDNKALVLYRNSNDYSLNGQVVTIEEDTIIAGKDTLLLDSDNSSAFSTVHIIPFSDTSVLGVYSGARCGYLSLSIADDDTITIDETESGTYVQPATSNLHNVGVAKTSGTEGEKVKVYCVGKPEPSAEITDLTGTTWYVPSGWLASAGYGEFNVSIDWTSPSNYYDRYGASYKLLIGYEESAGVVVAADNKIRAYYSLSQSGGTYFYFDIISNSEALSFTITGGTDVTNADLITWLKTYGIRR